MITGTTAQEANRLSRRSQREGHGLVLLGRHERAVRCEVAAAVGIRAPSRLTGSDRRRVGLFVALLSFLMMAPLPVTNVARAGSRCNAPGWTESRGDWTRMQAPLHIDAFAVDPFQPSRMYVSDGKTVMVSVNSGCSWKTVFQYDRNVGPDGFFPPAVRSISVPESRARHDYIYLLASEAFATATGPSDHSTQGGNPTLIVSKNGGRSWDTHAEGLPLFGRPVQMVIAPSNPKVLYMAISIGSYVVTGQAGREDSLEKTSLYKSDDGGESWSLVADNVAEPPLTVFDLAVDPRDHNALWLASQKGLYRSSDGGINWGRTNEIGPEPVHAVDVFGGRSSAPRIAAFRGGSMFWSEDGGKEWVKKKADEFYEVQSVAHGPRPTSLIVSSQTQIFRFEEKNGAWVDITPRLKADRLVVQDLYCDVTSDRTPRPAFYACTPTTLLRYTGRV